VVIISKNFKNKMFTVIDYIKYRRSIIIVLPVSMFG